jgi:hypothetical protein
VTENSRNTWVLRFLDFALQKVSPNVLRQCVFLARSEMVCMGQRMRVNEHQVLGHKAPPERAETLRPC